MKKIKKKCVEIDPLDENPTHYYLFGERKGVKHYLLMPRFVNGEWRFGGLYTVEKKNPSFQFGLLERNGASLLYEMSKFDKITLNEKEREKFVGLCQAFLVLVGMARVYSGQYCELMENGLAKNCVNEVEIPMICTEIYEMFDSWAVGHEEDFDTEEDKKKFQVRMFGNETLSRYSPISMSQLYRLGVVKKDDQQFDKTSDLAEIIRKYKIEMAKEKKF